MKKTNKTFIGLMLAAIMAAGTLTSCSYSSDGDMSASSTPAGGLVLNIKTTSVGSTRAALTSVNTANEQVVQNMVVGIFKNGTGSPVSITPYTPGTSADGLTQTITTSYTASTASTDQVVAGDEVLVAINVPTDRVSDFTGAASKTAFQGLTLSIAEAITHTATGTAIDEDALPMYGEGVVAASGNTFTADVTVIHTVAKVTLASLSVNFAETLHKNAAFTPEEVFLLNVPSSTDFGYTWAGSSNAGSYTYGFATVPSANFYTGETGSTWPATATAVQQYRADYIGSGALTLSALQTSSTAITTGYTFYTLPNNNTTYNTKLVIKGKYTDNVTLDATGHDAYYACDLYPDYSTDATDKSVQPNYHYSVTAVIKGDGADDAYSAIPSIESLESTVTALDFDDYQTTVTFNNGANYEALRPVKVGDLLFSDGTWGTLDEFPAKTPVAIVFSTDVSYTDYNANYTHGYAVALKDAVNPNSAGTYTMAWSTENVTIGTPLQMTSYVIGTQTTAGLNLSTAALQSDYQASDTYMDGRSETYYITQTSNYSQTVYPAAYAAINYAAGYESTADAAATTAPTGSSGWYLPSIGQLWELVYAFGGLSDSDTRTPRPTYCDFYWDGKASAVRTAINNAAAAALKNTAETVDKSSLWTNFIWQSSGTSGYYWSSTESAYNHSSSSAGYAFNLGFYTDDILYLSGNDAKSAANRRVRPVLAF